MYIINNDATITVSGLCPTPSTQIYDASQMLEPDAWVLQNWGWLQRGKERRRQTQGERQKLILQTLCYAIVNGFSMGPPACIGRSSQEKKDTYTLSRTLEPDAWVHQNWGWLQRGKERHRQTQGERQKVIFSLSLSTSDHAPSHSLAASQAS